MSVLEVRLTKQVYRLWVTGRLVRPLRDRKLIGDKEVIQMPGEECSRRRLLTDNPDGVFAIPVSGLSEDGLLAVIVVVGVKFKLPGHVPVRPSGVVSHLDGHVVRINYAPTCEGPGSLLDIFLGVVANAHREEFENLSPEVLVDVRPVIVLIVQPHNHRGVSRKL